MNRLTKKNGKIRLPSPISAFRRLDDMGWFPSWSLRWIAANAWGGRFPPRIHRAQ